MAEVDLRTLGPQLAEIMAPFVESQNSVKSIGLNTPPGSPATGDRYIIGTSPTGLWSGHAKKIARWTGAAWAFVEPGEGSSAWVDDEDVAYYYDGSSWATHRLASASASGLLSAAHYRKLASTLDVQDFTVGNAPLTTANFEAALNAAVAHAMTITPTPPVHVPAGEWNMTTQLTLLGRGNASEHASPRLIGAGRSRTILRWPESYTGVCVLLEGFATGPGSPMYYQGGLEALTIEAGKGTYGGQGIGIKARNSLWVTLREVRVAGFGAEWSDGISGGIGIWYDGNRTDIALENNQNSMWQDVTVSQCRTGLRTRAGMFAGFKVDFNQNKWCDVLVDGGNFFSVRDGMFQSSGGLSERINSGYPDHDAYGQNLFYAVRTWGNAIAGRSGTGAAVSAPSSYVTTVTGLTGCTEADVGRYLYLSGGANIQNGGFEIVEYVSATSVKIAKANGVVASGLTWAVHRYEGGDVVEIEGLVYHEGYMEAFAKLGCAEVGSSAFTFRVFPHNMTGLVEAQGACSLTIHQPPRESPDEWWVKLGGLGDRSAQNPVKCTLIAPHQTPDSHPEKFICDAASREHLVVVGGPTRSKGLTLTDVLAPAASEIIDPGVPSSLTITGGYVQAITGRLAGSTIAAPAAGRRAVYIPSHQNMGGKPALGMRKSGNRSMEGTLVSPPPAGSTYGLFAIVHLPTGYTDPGAGSSRGIALENAAGSEGMRITIDASDSTGTVTSYMQVVGPGSAAPQLALGGRRTMAIVAGLRVPEGAEPVSSIAIDDSATSHTYGGVAKRPATDPMSKLHLGKLPGHGDVGTDIDIAYVAVLHRPLTRAEERAVFRLADEYRVDLAGSVGAPPVRTGAFTVDSVADALVYVNVSGGAATATIPAGRAGDRITFKLVSAATNALTITGVTIDGAASLVLSSDYADVTLVSDGTEWRRLAGRPALAAGQAATVGRLTVDAILETPTTLTWAATTDVDTAIKNDFAIVLGGNTTLNFTAFAAGRQGNITVKQDATGSRTLAWTVAGDSSPSGWLLIKDTTTTDLNPQTAANSVTVYSYMMFALGGTNYVLISKVPVG